MTPKTSSEKKAEDGDEAKPRARKSSGANRPRSKALKARSKRMGLAGLAWSTIAMFTIAGLAALGIIGYAGWMVWDKTRPFGEQRAQQIDGVVNYRAKDVDWLTQGHRDGTLKYETSPPVGGPHNSQWQNCEGDIYTQQIPNEHAVHSLEHGAVWITYQPDLPKDQVEKLTSKVKGKDFTLMSPYPELKSPITLQSWGFTLAVDSANDPRIDEFIKAFRKESSVEPGAGCSGGVTVTGNEPVAGEQGMPQGGLPPGVAG